MTLQYDELLEKIGGFGKYQKYLFLVLFFPVIFNGLQLYLPNFILGEHKHRCKIPNEEDNYDRNVSNHPVYTVSTCTLEYNRTTHECTEWVYDQSVTTDSLISSFNIVCKDKAWREHLITASLIGYFIGNIGNNFFSDLYGRKAVVCFDFLMITASAIPISWVKNIIGILVLLGISGIARVGVYQVAFILAVEQVSPKYRVPTHFIEYMLFAVGLFVIVAAAYFLRDWHYLVMFCGFLNVTTIFHWFFLSESPRWLLSKGRTKEAMKILRKTAKMNNAVLDLDSKNVEVHSERAEPFRKSLKSLFSSCLLVRRLIVLAFSFFAVNVAYFGISLNIGILGGNVFINVVIAAITEVIGIIIPLFTLNRFGRKKMHCGSLIIGGVICLSTIFTSIYAKDTQWLTIVLAMVGKLAVTVNFFVVYNYTAELFPTVVRAVAFGICSTTGRIGTISSAYIGSLAKYIDTEFGSALPLIIFGTVALAGGLASLILPETTSKALPENAKDAKILGHEYKISRETKEQEINVIESTHI